MWYLAFSYLLGSICRLQVALDNPLLNDFIAALEQLSNPEMVFKVCFIYTTFCLFSCHDWAVCFAFFVFFLRLLLKFGIS